MPGTSIDATRTKFSVGTPARGGPASQSAPSAASGELSRRSRAGAYRMDEESSAPSELDPTVGQYGRERTSQAGEQDVGRVVEHYGSISAPRADDANAAAYRASLSRRSRPGYVAQRDSNHSRRMVWQALSTSVGEISAAHALEPAFAVSRAHAASRRSSARHVHGCRRVPNPTSRRRPSLLKPR
jgi:hypothetical protein